MSEFIQLFREPEPIALIVLLLLIGSLVQGMRRGASGSARRFFFFVWEGVVVIVCLVLAGQLTKQLSPIVADWLVRVVDVPLRELSGIEQAWFTLLTSLRDFALLRFGVLFLLGYLLLRAIAAFAEPLLARAVDAMLHRERPEPADRASGGRSASRVIGALIGAAHGAGRSFIFVALLFVYVSLLPNGWYADKISESPLYRETASWLVPVAGDMLAGQGPVLSDAVQAQFQQVLQRKYEIVDYNIPVEIEQAALYVTKDAQTKEEKARILYDWLGSRIAYDWDKANNYVQYGIWKEQTPPETFDSRRGVCIDIARLYVVMARAAGLESRVVTGMGSDGRGGYGPHAWNEVQIGESGQEWIPLDATWATSGDWFNPPRFEETHIRDV
ncbi:transglutaminase domain-containing protein [Paenibacillus sp. sgz302251]|uniref:transglutaminase domain-containing protein n=1 Tax=Paenibacillus sp. sgz302251 TaxID=3414493 RepID=UPI003C7CC14D